MSQATYPIVTQSRAVGKTLDHVFKLFLQQSSSLTTRLCVCRQGQDPLLHRRPDIGDRLSGGGVQQEGMIIGVAVSGAVSPKGRIWDTWHSGMPLG